MERGDPEEQHLTMDKDLLQEEQEANDTTDDDAGGVGAVKSDAGPQEALVRITDDDGGDDSGAVGSDEAKGLLTVDLSGFCLTGDALATHVRRSVMNSCKDSVGLLESAAASANKKRITPIKDISFITERRVEGSDICQHPEFVQWQYVGDMSARRVRLDIQSR